MVANFNGRTTELIKALASLPQEWVLTPVKENKRPYQDGWQNKKLDRKRIESELKSGKAKGYGLLTGLPSGGILAIDADGPAAHELLASYGELPPTVAFTSGIPGRCQYLFQVEKKFWDVVKTIKLKTGVKGEDGKEQLLELRWDGCQSVLPPSAHPTTGRYQWVSGSSPDALKIADCPVWVIELILNSNEEPPKNEEASLLQYQVQNQTQVQPVARYSDITVPVPVSVPLAECLAKSSRDLLEGKAA